MLKSYRHSTTSIQRYSTSLRYHTVPIYRSAMIRPGCWPVELPSLCPSWDSACGSVTWFGNHPLLRPNWEVPEIFNTKIGRQLTIERKNKFIEQHSVAFPLTDIRIPIQHPTRGPPPGPLRGTWSPPLGLILRPLLQPK